MAEEDFYLKESDREKTAYALKEGTTTKRGDKFDVQFPWKREILGKY